ncbi:carbohydrate kinase family protein [Cutibacterium sp. V947]|uniref:carbohydrate kinase family protein n=1 Tax=unclassified Cutibacterium TaxID=2649671 RepID=UPI003EE32B94
MTRPIACPTGRHGWTDVALCGQLFVDMVFADLARLPEGGEEIFTTTMAMAPGGVANLAVGLARLGARVDLSTDAGDDLLGHRMLAILDDEGVGLQNVATHPGWVTPVTVSLAQADDRRMITYQTPTPDSHDRRIVGHPRAVFVDLDPRRDQHVDIPEGAIVVGDLGFDESGRWDLDALSLLDRCDIIVPNSLEARALTGVWTVQNAAAVLASRVPTVIVTDGANGAWAVDPDNPEGFPVRPVEASMVDATGAGDEFDAAVLWGTLNGWPLARTLDLASLCSALTVEGLTGSLSTPGWTEIHQWWWTIGRSDEELATRFAFLADCPEGTGPARRPNPTVATP